MAVPSIIIQEVQDKRALLAAYYLFLAVVAVAAEVVAALVAVVDRPTVLQEPLVNMGLAVQAADMINPEAMLLLLELAVEEAAAQVIMSPTQQLLGARVSRVL